MSTADLRKVIMETTNINKNNLAKYIAVFIDKNLIKKEDISGFLTLNQALIPKISNDEMIMTFNIKLV